MNQHRLERQRERAKQLIEQRTATVVPLPIKKKKGKSNQLARLGAIRKELQLTQEDVAKYFNTTQQTVARWESGAAEPDLTQLRDFAILFGTSVEQLIGKGTVAVTRPFYLGEKTRITSGFWGHMGVLLPGAQFTDWYPITLAEYQRVSTNVADANADEPWVLAGTLANRDLAINVLNVRKIWFLPHGANDPEGDFDGDHIHEQHAFEFFRALEDLHPDFGDRGDYSDRLRQQVREFAQAFNGDLAEFLLYTNVYMDDGHKISYWADDPTMLANYGMMADSGNYFDTMIPFDSSEDGTIFVAPSKVAMIEMPSTECEKGHQALTEAFGGTDDED